MSEPNIQAAIRRLQRASTRLHQHAKPNPSVANNVNIALSEVDAAIQDLTPKRYSVEHPAHGVWRIHDSTRGRVTIAQCVVQEDAERICALLNKDEETH